MGYKINIYIVGKAHISEYNSAILGYEKRLGNQCKIQWIYCKNDKELQKNLLKKQYYCFDVQGEYYSSEEFSNLFKLELHLNFVIGGAYGICDPIKKKARALISFSGFTFPHQMVRLMATEQVYRALEIIKGSQYHK